MADHDHDPNIARDDSGHHGRREPGDTPSDGEIRETHLARDHLLKRYGQVYRKDYGWAAKGLDDKNPHLGMMLDSLLMGHWRPYIGLANDATHAGFGSLRWTVGTPDDWDRVPLGPTNLDLGEPGEDTALSLSMATSAFLTSRADLDALVDAAAFQVTALDVASTWVLAQSKHNEALVEEQEREREARRERRARSRARIDGDWPQRR